jgi:hypothetical protein
MMTAMTKAAKQELKTKRGAQAAFLFGAIISLAANIYASNHTPVGIFTGAIPAAALLVSVYLFENAPKSFWIKLALLAVAGIAAWASYWHLVEVFTAGGADTITAHTLPLTIDFTMGIASAVLNRKPTRRPAAKRTAAARRTRATTPAKLKSVA